MTNKQNVKSVFPSAYSFIRDGGSYEVWVDLFQNGSMIKGSLPNNLQLFYLASGKNWPDAWKQAWEEVQRRMLEKLES